tara:strand:- start:4365 stop:4685 length:321 start_codon:yes stop_codon:yes gene_type:complete
MKNLINLNEVCYLCHCSPPTIYRRLKTSDFPKPQKVPAAKTRGPRTINKWKTTEVTAWLRKEEQQYQVHTTRLHALGDWYTRYQIVLNAVIGGTLAGLAVSLFGGG